jgi:glycine hydroxymethyltransferase
MQEKKRQQHFINLIPSENFTSQAVLDALGSVMQSAFTGSTLVIGADSCR